MEIKKNKKLDLERIRLSALFVGFNYVSGIVLAAFTYQELNITETNKKINTGSADIVYEEVLVLEEQKEIIPPPPVIQPEPQQEIDLNQEIEIIDNTNNEVKETDVEVIEIVEDPQIIEVFEPVIDFPDVEASFNGGEEQMQMWMQENLQYPDISMEMGEQGKVYLTFVVEKDGSITNVEIIKGISRDLDNEAKRLIRTMPNWLPGEAKGLKVRSSFTMPINFELN